MFQECRRHFGPTDAARIDTSSVYVFFIILLAPALALLLPSDETVPQGEDENCRLAREARAQSLTAENISAHGTQASTSEGSRTEKLFWLDTQKSLTKNTNHVEYVHTSATGRNTSAREHEVCPHFPAKNGRAPPCTATR